MGDSDPLTLARARALRYLEARDRSRREVELRLRRYGHEESLVAEVLGWLEELGYLDDRRFAAVYAREKSRAGWGPRRIRAGLAAAGVSQPTVAYALEALAAESEADAGAAPAEEALTALVRRRFARDLERDPEGTTRRAAAFLQRRGHDWETTRRVLQAAFGDGEEQGFH